MSRHKDYLCDTRLLRKERTQTISEVNLRGETANKRSISIIHTKREKLG